MIGRILENPVVLVRHNILSGECHSQQIGNAKLHLFARLLGKKDSVDVGKDTTRSNGDSAQQLVQLLVVLDGKGDVTGHDTSLLVITGSVSGELQDLGTEVLEDGGEVDGSAGAHAGGALSLA
mmetsp:Transcript_18874/g.45319  ORF Transcript_18874/g.45319 Transcript_18874/m.45319 type:complete len:123 (-) Transcript_18874:9-377(-)